ncbi:putative alkaline serine protease [Podospora fimiseda]|uniref:Alkaline serine protease n=1 Tax=Podospora fimiseda TaxID=252190 RepID=A0AAN7H0T5_9PEZI|nr:putative alkaline serine protease [Podospora fimiseda]
MASEIVPGHYIVTLRPYATPSIQTSHLSFVAEKSAGETPFNVEVSHQFELPELRGYAASFDEETKEQIEALPEVAAVEPVQIYRHCLIQENAPWGLARISGRNKLPAAGPYKYKYTNTGEGAIAYVIDTGINDAHEEFEGRASKGAKFVTSSTEISDEDTNGHGTHVAGTIAGKTFGVAKGVHVVGVKVFTDGARPGARNDDIIKAIEWVVEQAKEHGKPSVINMSLGGGGSDALDRAVASAVRDGVSIVVAAGNYPNIPADQQSPAREPLAITVGATDKKDAAAQFNSPGKIVDILAPGVDILSTWIGSPTATMSINGTSMASPHVAGVVATLIAKEKTEPLLVMPTLLQWAEKGDITALKPRTVNVLVQISDA